MLLQRSILLEVCLLLAVSLVKAQYSYDKEKKSSPDGAPTFERPDYEKLFVADASAPVASKAGNKPEPIRYETPEDYEKLYLPSQDEEASNKNTVKRPAYDTIENDYSAYLKDFFESPKKQQEEQSRDEEVVRPGPSYVSHQVPAYPYENDEDKSASERVSSKDKDSDEDEEEGRVEKDDDDYKLPKFSFEPLNLKNNKQRVDYDTGKSSSTVSQYPEASQYPEVNEFGSAAAAATPYVSYHAYDPAADPYQAQNTRVYDTLVADPYGSASYNGYHPDPESDHVYETAPSDVITKFDEKNGCKKVSSEDDTNCFVCENPKTNAKYTQCNYKSNKEPVSYYVGNSAKYSMPHKGESTRYKRYAEKEEEEETDPYTIVKNRSLKAFDEDHSKDYDAGFQYEPEHYDETKPELTYSEQHAEDIKKNPENCKNVDRKGMTCTVCKDPKTGGNFEQCSYTSTPKEKKYAYVTEKKYDNDEPEETKIVPETKTVELTGESKVSPTTDKDKEDIREYTERIHQEKSPRKREDESQNEERRHEERRNEEESRNEDRRSKEDRDDDKDDYEKKPSEKKPVEHEEEDENPSYDVPSHFSSIKNAGDYRGSSSEASYKYPEYDFADFDEYHYKLFPEFAKSESRRQPVKQNYEDKNAYKVPEEKVPEVPNYQIPEATKQNVESVLAEFSKKDRSNCKKAEKKGMTCYLCVDKNNIQHEECMYVQESRPQSSHVAYHQVKAVKDKPEDALKLQPQPVEAESKRKHFFKKVTTPAPVALAAAASEQVGVSVPFKPEESKAEEVKAEASSYKEKRSSDDTKEEIAEPKAAASDFDDESDRISEKGEPTIHIPKLGTEEGTLTAETKPVYSKVLGIKLPKYMLEKSEFEKEFDEFAGSF